MGLFEDILLKAKDTANNLGSKAVKIVDVSKLKLELAETKSDLSLKFENIGKILYGSIKNGDFKSESVQAEIKEIDNLYFKIETLEKEIAGLKNKIVCKACGSVNNSDALYCNKCGHTLEIKCTYRNPEPSRNINVSPSDENTDSVFSDSDRVFGDSDGEGFPFEQSSSSNDDE